MLRRKTMHKVASTCQATILVIVLGILSPSAVHAVSISAQETSLPLQADLAAGDFALIAAMFRTGQPAQLHYTGSATGAGWTGALTGTFVGSPVDVHYSGDFGLFPSGTMTWTTTGSAGAVQFSGLGRVTLTDTPQGYLTELLYQRTLGGATITLQAQFGSRVNPDPETLLSEDLISGAFTIIHGQGIIQCPYSGYAADARVFDVLAVDTYTCTDLGIGAPFPMSVFDAFTLTHTGTTRTLAGPLVAELVPEPS